MGGKPLLQVRDLRLTLTKRHPGQAVVDGARFAIEEGSALGLLGQSGCGKSLTALAILGLLPPGVARVGGSIVFDGVDLTGLSDRELRRYRGGRIALVFQEPASAFNPVLRIGRQVEEVLEIHTALDRPARRRKVVDLLGEVGLPQPERVARQYPHELSGGMLQRAMIATALAGEPELLIADEPTTALDVTVQAQILELIRDIREHRSLALLWISHDLGVVAQVCDRVAVMQHGAVVEEGTVHAVLAAPQHVHTRELLAAAPRWEARS